MCFPGFAHLSKLDFLNTFPMTVYLIFLLIHAGMFPWFGWGFLGLGFFGWWWRCFSSVLGLAFGGRGQASGGSNCGVNFISISNAIFLNILLGPCEGLTFCDAASRFFPAFCFLFVSLVRVFFCFIGFGVVWLF